MKTYRMGKVLILVSLLLAGCSTLPPEPSAESSAAIITGRVPGPGGAFVEFRAEQLDDRTYEIVADGPGQLTQQQVLDGWTWAANVLAAGRPYEKQVKIEPFANHADKTSVGEGTRVAAGTKVSGRIVLNGAGSATGKVSRVPVKADARFTIAHLELAQVDVPPKLTRVVPPQSASGLLVVGGELFAGDSVDDGYANVQLIVDTWGIPREVQCVEASNARLARDAEALVAQLRYNPAKKSGGAVAVRIEQRIRFSSTRFPSPSATGGLPVNPPSRPWL